jgi:hypothetical protein
MGLVSLTHNYKKLMTLKKSYKKLIVLKALRIKQLYFSILVLERAKNMCPV